MPSHALLVELVAATASQLPLVLTEAQQDAAVLNTVERLKELIPELLAEEALRGVNIE